MKVKPIDSHASGLGRHLRLLGDAPLASGMAAREGEDPLAGLQRSQQPGPQGDAQFRARKIGQDMTTMNCEQQSAFS